MKGIDPVPRSTHRMEGMVRSTLRKGERVESAMPVWIGGTYAPFLGSIVIAVTAGAIVASLFALPSLIVVGLCAAMGAFVGRRLAMSRASLHPVRSTSLQVFVGLTTRRLLIYEPKSFGKPGRLLAEHPLTAVEAGEFEKGGLIRPSRLELVVRGSPHRFEFSGLWTIDAFLEPLSRRSP